jgi:hypothetical protein
MLLKEIFNIIFHPVEFFDNIPKTRTEGDIIKYIIKISLISSTFIFFSSVFSETRLHPSIVLGYPLIILLKFGIVSLMASPVMAFFKRDDPSLVGKWLMPNWSGSKRPLVRDLWKAIGYGMTPYELFLSFYIAYKIKIFLVFTNYWIILTVIGISRLFNLSFIKSLLCIALFAMGDLYYTFFYV